MIADRTATSIILSVRLLDNNNVPITGVLYNNGSLSIKYKRYGAAEWVDITPDLVPGTRGQYGNKTWVEDSEANGVYELGIPPESRVAGRRTVWKFKQGSNEYRYDAIDYVAIPSAKSADLEFNINIPGAEIIFSNDPEVFIKERDVTVKFTANQDVSAEELVLIFENADKTDKYVINDWDLTKSGSEVTFTLPIGFTEEEKSLSWAIRKASNNQLCGSGSINVTYAPHED